MKGGFKMEDTNKVKNILANIPRVKNIESSRNNEIPNQFIINGSGYTLFQSYSSPIAMQSEGKTYLFKNWDYSVTTGKYRNQFLGETKKETLLQNQLRYIPRFLVWLSK
jgi:hypothetical protein